MSVTQRCLKAQKCYLLRSGLESVGSCLASMLAFKPAYAPILQRGLNTGECSAADRFQPLDAAPRAVLASVDTLENGQNGASSASTLEHTDCFSMCRNELMCDAWVRRMLYESCSTVMMSFLRMLWGRFGTKCWRSVHRRGAAGAEPAGGDVDHKPERQRQRRRRAAGPERAAAPRRHVARGATYVTMGSVCAQVGPLHVRGGSYRCLWSKPAYCTLRKAS